MDYGRMMELLVGVGLLVVTFAMMLAVTLARFSVVRGPPPCPGCQRTLQTVDPLGGPRYDCPHCDFPDD